MAVQLASTPSLRLILGYNGTGSGVCGYNGEKYDPISNPGGMDGNGVTVNWINMAADMVSLGLSTEQQAQMVSSLLAGSNGWITVDGATIERLSDTQFTITVSASPSDLTPIFKARRALSFIQSASAYGYASMSSYNAGTGLTTVTVTGASLDFGLTEVWLGQDPANAPTPPATQDMPGIVKLATLPEAFLGEDDDKVVTPKKMILSIASLPAHYARSALGTIASMTDATGRRTYIPPGRSTCNINDGGFYLAGPPSMDLNDPANWDSPIPDYANPDNRAGVDVYTYQCDLGDGTSKLVFSVNTTYPTGFSATTSRKVGGFHCLCGDVGTISGHELTGFLKGDITPSSIWDLNWRSAGLQEGMFYRGGIWGMIYLPSYSGGKLVSANGGIIVDGASTWDGKTGFDWLDFNEQLAKQGLRPPTQYEFQMLSDGSNQGTNIAGSADPVTTGYSVDTTGVAMVSHGGGWQYCGVEWQAGIGSGAVAGTAAMKDQFAATRTMQRGQGYQEPTRGYFGGSWNNGVNCGSRASRWNSLPTEVSASVSTRGVAELLTVAP